MRRVVGFVGGLVLFLFWRVSSWVCSLPAWITLILHFTIGLPLYWFWATLAVWLIAGILRYLTIRFARWGASATRNDPPRENKNPYSASNDVFKKP
jgi:hypothetical protein